MTQPVATPSVPADDDEDLIRKHHDEIVAEKAAWKQRIAARAPTNAELASHIDGTVMALQSETVVVIGALRDFMMDYVDQRIDEAADESQILGEDAEKIVNLAQGTLLLIAEVRASGGSSISPEAKKSLDLLEALAKEVQELTENATVGDDDDDEEGEDDDEEDEDDAAPTGNGASRA